MGGVFSLRTQPHQDEAWQLERTHSRARTMWRQAEWRMGTSTPTSDGRHELLSSERVQLAPSFYPEGLSAVVRGTITG